MNLPPPMGLPLRPPPHMSAAPQHTHYIPSWSVVNMSDAQHNQLYLQNLSWSKLHLSKAKLKASSRTSALLSGFAMVAMVEVQLNKDEVPDWLLVSFAICTTLLVAVHMLALMISTCILPNIEAISNIHSVEAIKESPHEQMHCYIETAWAFSTVFGILLFLCEILLLCWVKFLVVSFNAGVASTVILIPVVIVFLSFAVHFYRKLVGHKYQMRREEIDDLENLASRLETGDYESSPRNGLVIQDV